MWNCAELPVKRATGLTGSGPWSGASSHRDRGRSLPLDALAAASRLDRMVFPSPRPVVRGPARGPFLEEGADPLAGLVRDAYGRGDGGRAAKVGGRPLASSSRRLVVSMARGPDSTSERPRAIASPSQDLGGDDAVDQAPPLRLGRGDQPPVSKRSRARRSPTWRMRSCSTIAATMPRRTSG